MKMRTNILSVSAVAALTLSYPSVSYAHDWFSLYKDCAQVDMSPLELIEEGDTARSLDDNDEIVEITPKPELGLKGVIILYRDVNLCLKALQAYQRKLDKYR